MVGHGGGAPCDGVELLGARLRAARVDRSLGVRELARLVDCSASLISQIESGRARPSVATLYALGTALGVSLDVLLGTTPSGPAGTGVPSAPSSEPEGSLVVLRAAARRRIDLARGVGWQLLTPVPERDIEFMEVRYDPGGGAGEHDHAIRHSGREYCLVLEGFLSAQLCFDEYLLGPGDSMAFESAVPHRFWNGGLAPVRAVWFVADRWAGDRESSGAGLGSHGHVGHLVEKAQGVPGGL